MKYSEKLNGYWEEGYHYYIEIRDDVMTIRNYMRKVDLKTHISYDADLLDEGKRTVITAEDTVLSRDANGEPFTMIRELAYEDGELKFLYYYTIMGETLYTLKKADHDPFDHIIIRDDEFLDALQGDWFEWRANGNGDKLTIRGNRLTWYSAKDAPIHVVSYKHAPDLVRIVPEDLTETDFSGFNAIEVCPDMLTTYIHVFDMSVPMTVFARADMLDKIEVPGAAKITPRCTMCPPDVNTVNKWMTDGPGMTMTGFMGMQDIMNKPDTAPDQEPKRPKFCPQCGYQLKDYTGHFCPECGTKL